MKLHHLELLLTWPQVIYLGDLSNVDYGHVDYTYNFVIYLDNLEDAIKFLSAQNEDYVTNLVGVFIKWNSLLVFG